MVFVEAPFRAAAFHLSTSCRAKQAAEKLQSAVILRSSGDEESRIALKKNRARSFA
jgi:hypothetical protein